MSPKNLLKLKKYLPFWEYYKANKCIPPINLPTLEAIAVIYREELHPAPVRLYCSVCVEEMITTLFHQYERDSIKIVEPKETNEANEQTQPQSEKLLPSGNQKNKNKRGRKVKRRKRKTRLG